ncbi:hypothetical protein ACHAPF_003194 [Botrytis cinerea]
MGAYTTLFAGLSKEITEANQGSYIIPWGRVQEINPRKDIYEVIEKGKGKELWEWCEKQIKANRDTTNNLYHVGGVFPVKSLKRNLIAE